MRKKANGVFIFVKCSCGARFFCKLGAMKFENLKMMATLLLAAVSAFAQTPASVMEKSSAWFCGSKGWELDFRATVQYANSPETATQSGILLVGDRNKFRLAVPGIAFYSDGVTLWQWNKEQKQVLIKAVADLPATLHPSEMLFKYLNCKATALKKDSWKSASVYVLTLDPSKYGKDFTAMEVWLSALDYSPVRLSTTDPMGNVTWYDISNIRKMQKVADAEFKYKSVKGVDEVDMR